MPLRVAGERPLRPDAERMLRLGTRGSALALAQARLVAAALERQGTAVSLVTIRTAGDDHRPDEGWGEGAFVSAIERALRRGEVDLAVHSAKDLPTTEPPDLMVAAFLPRADPRDALVGPRPGLRFVDLPTGARVGTDSPRRSRFLRRLRPDLETHPLDGNVDRRLERLAEGETDALILAVAGLERLGRADRIGQVLSPQVIFPAPGQGAIAIQVRTDDAEARDLVATVDDAPTRSAVTAERSLLAALGGGCRAPIGALARVRDGRLHLRAAWAGPQGEVRQGRAEGDLDAAVELGQRLAARLVAPPRRGTRVSRRPYDGAGTSAGPRVLVTRPTAEAGPLVAALRRRGLQPVVVPAIRVSALLSRADLGERLARLSPERIVVASPTAARLAVEACRARGLAPARCTWAAVGPGSAEPLARARVAAWLPTRADAATLAAELPLVPGERILVLCGELAAGSLVGRLAERGARGEEIVVYRTVEAPAPSRRRLASALAEGRPAAIAFTSGSTVRGFVGLAGLAGLAGPDLDGLRAIPAVCIGQPTAAAARSLGFLTVETADRPTPAAMAAAAARAVGMPSA
ncbi:MAG TPA: hydroxymethylbilane synthase [Candidatus Limnocylindrales bacterium]|nr:hydroxymethylbilane synthase [Candidatus Limnocylindrales bacterium]